MPTVNFIEAGAARIDTQEMRHRITDTDAIVERASEQVKAAAAAIRLILKEPDSLYGRLNIKSWCDAIEFHAEDVANAVSALAERLGAPYINESRTAEAAAITAAVRKETQHA